MNHSSTAKKELGILAIILLTSVTLVLAALARATPDDRQKATVVPAAYANGRGAEDWDEAKWQAFNDSPLNDWSLTRAEIQARNARGPTEWLPPLDQCLYMSRFAMTLEHFNLDSDAAETRRRAVQRQRCYTQFQ